MALFTGLILMILEPASSTSLLVTTRTEGTDGRSKLLLAYQIRGVGRKLNFFPLVYSEILGIQALALKTHLEYSTTLSAILETALRDKVAGTDEHLQRLDDDGREKIHGLDTRAQHDDLKWKMP